MAKPYNLSIIAVNCLADAGKGTVAKPQNVAGEVMAVLPTQEKELWQSRRTEKRLHQLVLPTLEKELWQSSGAREVGHAPVLPTLEKELWQSLTHGLNVSQSVLPTLEKELWQSAFCV